MFRVLFVCTGNICRSPTAEGVFRALVEREGLGGVIEIESAGISGYHVGEPPDPRSQEAALLRGIDLSAQRARRVHQRDFNTFDMILAMDRGHLTSLRRMAPRGSEKRLSLFLSWAADAVTQDVPDPYYGAANGFDDVLDLIEAGSDGLLAHIRTRL